jgi:hypothetical protein
MKSLNRLFVTLTTVPLLLTLAACGFVGSSSGISESEALTVSGITIVEEPINPLMRELDEEAFLERVKALRQGEEPTFPLPSSKVVTTRVSLEEAHDLVSEVWIPSYLPEGFTLERSLVVVHNHPHYAPDVEPASSLLIRNETGVILEILVAPLRENRGDVRIPVGTSAGSKIQIDEDTEGILVRGRWVTRVGRDLDEVSSSWNEDAGTQITFRRGDRLFEVVSTPGKLEVEELLKVAQSLMLHER